MTAQGVDAGRAPRSVRVIYIARALSFACAFGVLTLLAWQRGMGSSIWLGLALQFLVYPHVLYALSCRAGDPKRAELNHLWLDSLLLGAWLAVFGFSEWIAFGLVLATTQNSIVFRGLAACAGSLLLFAAGALSAGATAGFPYEPEVGRAVFILCMACISTRPPCVSAGTVMPFSPPRTAPVSPQQCRKPSPMARPSSSGCT